MSHMKDNLCWRKIKWPKESYLPLPRVYGFIHVYTVANNFQTSYRLANQKQLSCKPLFYWGIRYTIPFYNLGIWPEASKTQPCKVLFFFFFLISISSQRIKPKRWLRVDLYLFQNVSRPLNGKNWHAVND